MSAILLTLAAILLVAGFFGFVLYVGTMLYIHVGTVIEFVRWKLGRK